MTVDPLRLAEAGTEGALLAVLLLPATGRGFGPELIGVLAAMFLILASSAYALHAVTFDCLRITGQRSRRTISYTRSEE
jgi:hypothetical protein